MLHRPEVISLFTCDGLKRYFLHYNAKMFLNKSNAKMLILHSAFNSPRHLRDYSTIYELF